MIQVIDSISGISPNRLTTPPSTSSANSKKEVEKTTKENQKEVVKAKSANDLVALSFNLKGDVESLRNSVATVVEQIKVQLRDYYGLESEEEDENEFLPPENASAQQLMDYVSPQNTADRILGFTTGFFDAYTLNHEDATDEENVNEFSALIGSAIRKGFDEAEKILGDFDNLGEIGEQIKETYQMVLKGLKEFRQEHLNDLGPKPESPESSFEEAQLEDTDMTEIE